MRNERFSKLLFLLTLNVSIHGYQLLLRVLLFCLAKLATSAQGWTAREVQGCASETILLNKTTKLLATTATMSNKKSLGFTLLEVLIALFIFTIVSIIMVSGLHSVFNSQSATAKQSERLSTLQITLLLLSRDLEQTIDRPVNNAKGLVESPLVGSPRSIAFTHTGLANPLGQLQRATLQRTHYYIDKEYFIRETWDVLDQSSKSQTHQRILLDTASDVRFEYMDSKNRFHNNWPPPDKQQANLPRAVRVHLSLKNWGKISQTYVLVGQEPLDKSN